MVGSWLGDPGGTQINHGPSTPGSDLLYATKTERKAFAAYTQWAWDINEDFTLTTGPGYASGEYDPNLFRYRVTADGQRLQRLIGGNALPAFGLPGLTRTMADGTPIADIDASPIAKFNLQNGGLIDNGDGTYTATDTHIAGRIPLPSPIYRPFHRQDEEWTWRVNLDWNITPDDMIYFGVTTGTRSGGYNKVFFSTTAYDPEELTNYELGYKTQWLDGALGQRFDLLLRLQDDP